MMSNEIKNINSLPSIDKVKKISQGFALLDAIMMPEWEYRYFSFNSRWDENGNTMMASMRDGSGGEYFMYFSDKGAVGKLLYEEQLENPSLCLRNIPDCFDDFKNEPAFNLDSATFYYWRCYKDKEWSASPNNLNAYPVLGFLVGGYLAYQNWAENYYEKTINVTVLKEVYSSLSVTTEQLAILNPEITIEDLSEDIHEIVG